MAVLVQWRNGGTLTTVRASSIQESALLPEHIAVIGVRGVTDPSFPNVEIQNIFVRRDDVVYVAEGVPKPEHEFDGSHAATDSDLRGSGPVDNVGDKGSGERVEGSGRQEPGVDKRKDSRAKPVQKPDGRNFRPYASGGSGRTPAC